MSVGTDMKRTTETADTAVPAAEAVAFIDAWLEEHGWVLDTRAIDFALDLRHLLSGTASETDRDETRQVPEPV